MWLRFRAAQMREPASAEWPRRIFRFARQPGSVKPDVALLKHRCSRQRLRGRVPVHFVPLAIPVGMSPIEPRKDRVQVRQKGQREVRDAGNDLVVTTRAQDAVNPPLSRRRASSCGSPSKVLHLSRRYDECDELTIVKPRQTVSCRIQPEHRDDLEERPARQCTETRAHRLMARTQQLERIGQIDLLYRHVCGKGSLRDYTANRRICRRSSGAMKRPHPSHSPSGLRLPATLT
jgi:hypothetical protein